MSNETGQTWAPATAVSLEPARKQRLRDRGNADADIV